MYPDGAGDEILVRSLATTASSYRAGAAVTVEAEMSATMVMVVPRLMIAVRPMASLNGPVPFEIRDEFTVLPVSGAAYYKRRSAAGDLPPQLEQALSEFHADGGAISTYFTISAVFFYVGLIPDIAIFRDHALGAVKKVYSVLALGWRGTHAQWHSYMGAYGFFAGELGAAIDRKRFRTIIFTIRRGFCSIEDVVRRIVDEPGVGTCCLFGDDVHRFDIDAVSALRIGLGLVYGGVRGRIDDHLRSCFPYERA